MRRFQVFEIYWFFVCTVIFNENFSNLINLPMKIKMKQVEHNLNSLDQDALSIVTAHTNLYALILFFLRYHQIKQITAINDTVNKYKTFLTTKDIHD